MNTPSSEASRPSSPSELSWAHLGRGQVRESLAAAVDPQQSPAQTSAPAGGPSAHDGESQMAASAETIDRLKEMGASAASDPAASDRTVSHDPAQPASGAAATKTDGPPRSAHLSAISSDHLTERPIQKLLQDRLHMLDEHSKLTLALREATSPEVSPEHQAEQLKAELKQIQVMLAQADKNPQTLLPSSFHKAPGMAPPALVSEMKDAIDAATHELGEWKNKAETLKTGRADRENQKKARAVERDKVFKLVTAWTAQSVEYEKAVTDVQTVEDGRLAQERLVSFQLALRLESLRLHVIEAQISLDARLAGIRDLEAQVCHFHIQLAERALSQMRARFCAESDKQESDLNQAAADEKNKAAIVRRPPRALSGPPHGRASGAESAGTQV